MKFQFDSVPAFLAMDGHGIYVWLAYAVSVTVFVWLVIQPLVRQRGILKSLARAQASKTQSANHQHKAGGDDAPRT